MGHAFVGLPGRWALVLLAVVVGAGAGVAFGEYHRSGVGPYRSSADIEVHDSPLVYHIPGLAFRRVDDPGGMAHQLELATEPATLSRAARSLGVPPAQVREELSVRLSPGHVIVFQVEDGTRGDTRRILDAAVNSYRERRRAELGRALTAARAFLVRQAASARAPGERTNIKTQIRFADLLRERLPDGTLVLSTSTKLKTRWSPAVAGSFGMLAGLLLGLLIAFMPMLARVVSLAAATAYASAVATARGQRTAGAIAIPRGSPRERAVATLRGIRVAIGPRRPALLLMLLLLVRPLADRSEASKVRLGGGLALNIAGALGLVLLISAIAVLARARSRFYPSGSAAYAALLLVSVAAAAVALHDIRSQVGNKPLEELVRLAALGAAYLLAANVAADASSVRLLFVVTGLAGVIPALVGLEQWVHGLPRAQGLTIARVSGTFSGPNAYGAYLAAVLLLLIFLPPGWLPRWARIGAITLFAVALIGSFSRTGWSMLVVGLIGLGWKRHKKLLVASAAIAVVLSVVVPSVRERVYSSTGSSANGTATSRFVPSSYQWRIDTWHALLLKYRERPLIGFGLRSTPFVNPRQLHFGGQVTGYDAHNSVVKLLIEGGPALVAGWAIFFAIVITKAVRMARARWAFQPAARIVLGLWAVVAFIGLTADDLLAATALMLVVMTLTGAVEGAWRRENLQPGPS